MNEKKVTIRDRLVSYRTAVRGNWVIKASNYNDIQVLLVGFNKLSGHHFVKVFTDFREVVEYLEFITFNQLPAMNDEQFPTFDPDETTKK